MTSQNILMENEVKYFDNEFDKSISDMWILES